MAIAIVPLSLKTSAKDLQTKASYAVYSMWLGSPVVPFTLFFWVMGSLIKSPTPKKGALIYDMVAGLLRLAIGLIEMACAFSHGIATWFSDQPNNYCMVGKRIPEGLFDMGMAFGGIAILPYVLADMLNPRNAKKVVVKATTRIMLFYLSVAMIGYFGWADTIEKRAPLQVMMQKGFWYQNAARIISALFVLKNLGK